MSGAMTSWPSASKTARIRTLTVIDEYTRECLALRTDYKLGADEVMDVLTS